MDAAALSSWYLLCVWRSPTLHFQRALSSSPPLPPPFRLCDVSRVLRTLPLRSPHPLPARGCTVHRDHV